MNQPLTAIKNKIGLNSFALKMIAMATMLVDHIGAVYFPQYTILRIIGRIAFPIFCFLLVEGSFHTHDINRYIFRLFLFGIISELPFDFALHGGIYVQQQNVMFTLALGLIAIKFIGKYPYHGWDFAAGIAAIVLAELLQTDYGGGGVALILIFYYFRNSDLGKTFCSVLVYCVCYGGLEVYAILAQPFWELYNGKQGPKCKQLFYWFYPVHLALLYVIGVIWF